MEGNKKREQELQEMEMLMVVCDFWKIEEQKCKKYNAVLKPYTAAAAAYVVSFSDCKNKYLWYCLHTFCMEGLNAMWHNFFPW